MIEAIGVVVPVHDEERDLATCLASIRRAAKHPELAAISVRISVVLDRCSDASGEIASQMLVIADRIAETRAGNVGVARNIGFDLVRRAESGLDDGDLWLATTDADSIVPDTWLARQVRLANSGADAIAGTIEIEDWDEQPAGARARFDRRYEIAPDGTHGHVHGANLGVRSSTLAAVGGMPRAALAEDHALISLITAHGASIARPATLCVQTSARRESRAPGGFSDFLRHL